VDCQVIVDSAATVDVKGTLCADTLVVNGKLISHSSLKILDQLTVNGTLEIVEDSELRVEKYAQLTGQERIILTGNRKAYRGRTPCKD
jgi:hypothetical protein